MRWMAIDHGLARIGIALSDPEEILATPYDVWPNAGDRTVERLAALAVEESVEAIVIGLPRHRDGKESDTAGAVRVFAEALGRELGRVTGREAGDPGSPNRIPVTFRDEAMTSVEAERILGERGVKQRDRGKKRDALAAALILEDLLVERKLRNNMNN
jgi:putative Holliday junction resolvase